MTPGPLSFLFRRHLGQAVTLNTLDEHSRQWSSSLSTVSLVNSICVGWLSKVSKCRSIARTCNNRATPLQRKQSFNRSSKDTTVDLDSSNNFKLCSRVEHSLTHLVAQPEKPWKAHADAPLGQDIGRKRCVEQRQRAQLLSLDRPTAFLERV